MEPLAVQAVKTRLRENHAEIARSMQLAFMGNPYAAEPDPDRRRARLQAKANLTQREASAVSEAIERVSSPELILKAANLLEDGSDDPEAPAVGAEKVWGDTLDFVNVGFLEKGARIARAVGRVAFRNGRAQGSGFLIGEGLFITNHHVISSPEFASNLALDFDYELDLLGNTRPATRFAIDTAVFVTDPDTQDGLDYTIVAVGERLEGNLAIETFGWSGLSDSSDKHMLGEFANIVQHPSGRFKEVVLRENRLVGRYANALHYVADTEPGSSGSPVFNSEWRPIALHHWGGPWRELFDDDGAPANIEVNEGIRISAIVRQLRDRLRDLPPSVRDRLARALNQGEAPETSPITLVPPAETAAAKDLLGAPRVDDSGRASWIIPLEISVQIPALARSEPKTSPGLAGTIANTAPPGERTSEAIYRDRGGYKRGFIENFDVPLPTLDPSLVADAAPNRFAEPGDDPFELKYHHFSVVMNARRRLAFFTACNIDGASAKEVDRKTKTVRPLRPNSSGLEERAEDAEAESWRGDPRIASNELTGTPFYDRQRIPGFLNPQARGRIARMFQKGHLVRRLDPCWGTDQVALEAEADSFHYTNAAPQVGFFNQGTAGADKPGGGKLWRAVENYVLRGAVADQQRVTSFTGPIFASDDRDYRGVLVPRRFFKVTVWAEDGELRSLAMIADQGPVIETWPEALFEGGEAAAAEAFMDADELDKVEDFLSTIAEIEKATKLDFGNSVREADIRNGAVEEKIDNEADIALRPSNISPGRPERRSSKALAPEGRRSARRKSKKPES